MMQEMVHWTAALALLVVFAAISIASFTHFDGERSSRGNAVLRAASALATLMFFVWAAEADVVSIWCASGALLAALVAILIKTMAYQASKGASLHVAFTGSGPAELLTDGIYGWIRNPFYAAYLLYWAGWTIYAGLAWWAIVIFAGFSIAYLFAVGSEERFLLRAHGDDYAAYCARTGRFLPRYGRLTIKRS